MEDARCYSGKMPAYSGGASLGVQFCNRKTGGQIGAWPTCLSPGEPRTFSINLYYLCACESRSNIDLSEAFPQPEE